MVQKTLGGREYSQRECPIFVGYGVCDSCGGQSKLLWRDDEAGKNLAQIVRKAQLDPLKMFPDLMIQPDPEPENKKVLDTQSNPQYNELRIENLVVNNYH